MLERNGGTTRLLLPFWRERARGAQVTEDCPTLTGGGHETSGVMISDDLGESWFPAGRIADPQGKTWLIEGTVATAGAGQLYVSTTSNGCTLCLPLYHNLQCTQPFLHGAGSCFCGAPLMSFGHLVPWTKACPGVCQSP